MATTQLYRTRDCACTAPVVMGSRRPEKCEHGNHFWTERQLNPPERKALPAKSKKRAAEEESGARPKQRGGSTLKRGKGFEASKAQRDKVRLLPCLACGHGADFPDETGVDPAHLWPRGKGGCDSPDCVVPLCRSCHRAFDQGELDLTPRLADSEAWSVEQAHPILEHGVSVVELVRRLAGNRQELVWVERDSVAV